MPTRRFGPADILLTRHLCLWAALELLAAVVFAAQPARAAVTKAWVQRYSNVMSNSIDGAYKIVCDTAGNIIVVGFTERRLGIDRDMLTIKYSGTNGSVLWQNRYRNDGVGALALDASGNLIVMGVSYIAKYATADGALLWEKRGPSGGSAMKLDSSGDLLVTGTSWNGTNFDFYTAKYAAADGALLWEKRYNSPANRDDVAHGVAVDGSDNAIMTGLSDRDGYTAKYGAADGALLWEKRGPRIDESALAVDSSDSVIVTGSSFNGTNNDYYTAKYASADGALLWEQFHNGPGTGRKVVVDANDNVIVTGFSSTAKYAASGGALLWEKPGPGIALAMALDGSGNVVVTGASHNGTNYDYYTAKYAAANGALLWEKRYNGPGNCHDFAGALAMDGSGNVLVTGNSIGDRSGIDFYTAKYAAADGALLWEQRYNSPAYNDDRARAVAVDGSGDVIVTGTSYSYSDCPDTYSYAGGYTAKYAANGALLWETRSPGIYCRSIGAAVAVDAAGNVIAAGHYYNCNAGGCPDDSYTAKYAAANGALLWEKGDGGKGIAAVTVDGEGNVIVTGWGSCHHSYTGKYAAADGALLWEQRYNGPPNSWDEARAVAVDAGGNVVVAGYSNNGTNNDYYTAKYAALDGGLIWEKQYNGPANADDEAYGVAVDGSGNVLVTGYSSNGTNNDYYTAKYAAANGALLWGQRYDGPANSDDKAAAVAVDGSGNVVVTGSTHNGSNVDYYTVKYAATDGTVLWGKRYNGPANHDDSAQAVAVDGNGNVVVTGYSGNGPNADYYTSKYAAADGAVLWEQRYNGTANGNDFVGGSRSLALGPNGMVAVTGSSEGSLGYYDYATIVYWENLPPVAIALVPTGVRIRVPGVPGHAYTIQRAPAASGPWSTIATSTAPSNGVIEYTDLNPPAGRAFYRTSEPTN